MSALSAGGSSEGEEQRGNILGEESKEKQMQKIMGRCGCLALGWEQGECDFFLSLCWRLGLRKDALLGYGWNTQLWKEEKMPLL